METTKYESTEQTAIRKYVKNKSVFFENAKQVGSRLHPGQKPSFAMKPERQAVHDCLVFVDTKNKIAERLGVEFSAFVISKSQGTEAKDCHRGWLGNGTWWWPHIPCQYWCIGGTFECPIDYLQGIRCVSRHVNTNPTVLEVRSGLFSHPQKYTP